jgi:hypothetical protein
MTPLRVQARIVGQVAMPHAPIALDSLLAAMVCLREGRAAATPAEVVPIQIPVEREPRGRFHLASCCECKIDHHRLKYINRRFPIDEAQMFGAGVKSLNIAGGPAKSYRLPLDTVFLVDDLLTWWCVGVEDDVRELLSMCMGLGKRRGVGLGVVTGWTVEPCDTWDGFPVVRNGRALRNLPVDWPGLVEPNIGYGNLTYPYQAQLNPNEREIATPEWGE